MAQLSDDCFAFGGPMMSVDEAVAIIAARVSAVDETEIVPLERADGRILAGAVSASLALPPFTNSAVDGYAVRSDDIPKRKETAFPVSGRIQAGAAAKTPVKPGEAFPRSSPAAAMPRRRELPVFMQEETCAWMRPARSFFHRVCRPGANQCAPRVKTVVAFEPLRSTRSKVASRKDVAL